MLDEISIKNNGPRYARPGLHRKAKTIFNTLNIKALYNVKCNGGEGKKKGQIIFYATNKFILLFSIPSLNNL
jgi:hypothetical protein